MRLITWIRQKLCKHQFTKRWNRNEQRYIYKCVKCGKEITRDEKENYFIKDL